MNVVISALINVMVAISDHGNVIYSKSIYYCGLFGIGTGLTIGVTNIASETARAVSDSWGVQEYGAVIAIVSGVMLILKTGADLWFRIADRIEEKREKKLARETGPHGDRDV